MLNFLNLVISLQLCKKEIHYLCYSFFMSERSRVLQFFSQMVPQIKQCIYYIGAYKGVCVCMCMYMWVGEREREKGKNKGNKILIMSETT